MNQKCKKKCKQEGINFVTLSKKGKKGQFCQKKKKEINKENSKKKKQKENRYTFMLEMQLKRQSQNT